EGATGAEIKAICTEAALHAIREGRVVVEKKDFLYAIDKILKKRFRPYATSSQLTAQSLRNSDITEYHL
ncbi:MAG: hypothetical protein QXG81_06905, partial [Ignisphaera sp.]